VIHGSVEAQSRFRSRPSGTAVCPGSLDLTHSTSFTINEFASVVEGGHQVPIGGGKSVHMGALWGRSCPPPSSSRFDTTPCSATPGGPGDPRKSAGGAKSGFGENIRVAVPVIQASHPQLQSPGTSSTPRSCTGRCDTCSRSGVRGRSSSPRTAALYPTWSPMTAGSTTRTA
jgi:hypothetical protein